MGQGRPGQYSTTTRQQTVRLWALAKRTDSTGQDLPPETAGKAASLFIRDSFAIKATRTEKQADKLQTEGVRHALRQRQKMMVVYGCLVSVSRSLSFVGCSWKESMCAAASISADFLATLTTKIPWNGYICHAVINDPQGCAPQSRLMFGGERNKKDRLL